MKTKIFLPRNLQEPIQDLALSRNKMVFLSGPRQCGKTTLAKAFIPNKNSQLKELERHYFNWDQAKVKKLWLTESALLAEKAIATGTPILILDEFHKNQKWKNQLKGFYDEFGEHLNIVVTGSAKLNTFQRGADSLLGRFIHFHVLPFSFGELLLPQPMALSEFENWLKAPRSLISSPSLAMQAENCFQKLFEFGGFPEPYSESSKEIYHIWSQNRIELLIRQDLRDLSNILHIAQIEILASFLPDRVGSPLSIKSLQEDLDGSYSSIQRWLRALSMVYYHFEVKPYSASIPRSLKKEGKYYLFDWRQVENYGPRFENMVAMHLLKFIQYYSDTGQAKLGLHYLRTKDQEEVDFLVTKNNKPLFSVEVKTSSEILEKNYLRFQKHLKVPHFQIINKPRIIHRYPGATVIGFTDFFAHLP